MWCCSEDLTGCCAVLQARSDYGQKVRHLFSPSGEPKVFTNLQQLGGGAGQATSPEVTAASLLGPDHARFQGTTVWDVMKGCDTWAAGRMMLELLLTQHTSASGLPALGHNEYQQSDIPALPGYSVGLYKVLTGMMAFDPAARLSPE